MRRRRSQRACARSCRISRSPSARSAACSVPTPARKPWASSTSRSSYVLPARGEVAQRAGVGDLYVVARQWPHTKHRRRESEEARDRANRQAEGALAAGPPREPVLLSEG